MSGCGDLAVDARSNCDVAISEVDQSVVVLVSQLESGENVCQ